MATLATSRRRLYAATIAIATFVGMITLLSSRHPVSGQNTITNASVDYAPATLQIDPLPELSTPVTITFTTTPTISVGSADVQISVPAGFDISSAAPGGYSVSAGIVTWSDISVSANTAYSYTVTGESIENYTGWVLASLANTENPSSATGMVSRGLLVHVDDNSAQVEPNGASIIRPNGPHLYGPTLYDTPLTTQLAWSHFPDTGDTVTATLHITNTSGSSVSYSGGFTPPSGWSIVSGSDTWSGTLGSGQSTTRVLSTETDTEAGSWDFIANVLLPYSPGTPGFRITQHGYFSGDGLGWDELQDYERVGGGSLLLHTSPRQLPVLLRATTPLPAEAAETALTARPQSCGSSDVRVTGHVSIQTRGDQERDAAFLGYQFMFRVYTAIGGGLGYTVDWVSFSDRLTDDGNYDVCFPLEDGYAYGYLWVYATDAPGGKINEPWSSRVYRLTEGNHRVVDVAHPDPWEPLIIETGVDSEYCDPQHPGMLCVYDLDIGEQFDEEGETGMDPAIFRLAAMHAEKTRDFMMTQYGPEVGETRSAGDISAHFWRAAVYADDLAGCPSGAPSCAGFEGYYQIGAGTVRADYNTAFIYGNHEYGHETQTWLNGGPPPLMGMGGDWTEGWADGFLAAISHWRWGHGYANYNCNQEIEDLSIACGQNTNHELNTAATMLDLWDPDADEPFGNTTWADPATHLYHTAWQLVADGEMRRACEFRDAWGELAEPARQIGIDVMDHDGIEPCASPATATPTPTPTRTPTPTPTPCLHLPPC